MSSNVPIQNPAGIAAPTPQNTPLTQAPIAHGLSRPTVPDISEGNEDEGGEGGGAAGGEDGPLKGLEQHMLGMVHGKLATLLGKSSGYIESLPVETKLNVEALKGVQVKQNELHQKYKQECLELEKKYLELQKPLYDRRNALINGKASATQDEIQAGEDASIKDDEEYEPLPKGHTPSPNGIPEFWLTALRNHVGLNDLITDRDCDALKHLIDVRLEYLQDGEATKDTETQGKPGFKILFEFSENAYFENKVLEKTYLYQEEVGYSGDFVYDKAIGSTIKWKDDKDLTKEFEIKKQRNKNTNRTRLVRKARPTDSFFNFFSPPEPPSEEAIENGDIDDEELEELEEKLEVDYQIGEDLKEKIIPRAIDFFTGKALEYEVMEDDDDYDDDEDDEDEDDDEDFDDDSDSDGGPPTRRRVAPLPKKGGPKGAAAGAGGAGAGVNPEECKQQ